MHIPKPMYKGTKYAWNSLLNGFLILKGLIILKTFKGYYGGGGLLAEPFFCIFEMQNPNASNIGAVA